MYFLNPLSVLSFVYHLKSITKMIMIIMTIMIYFICIVLYIKFKCFG